MFKEALPDVYLKGRLTLKDRVRAYLINWN
jgi:hypothetical protein